MKGYLVSSGLAFGYYFLLLASCSLLLLLATCFCFFLLSSCFVLLAVLLLDTRFLFLTQPLLPSLLPSPPLNLANSRKGAEVLQVDFLEQHVKVRHLNGMRLLEIVEELFLELLITVHALHALVCQDALEEFTDV